MESTKVGSGYLATNDRKEKANQADYTGKLEVNGTDYRIAGWVRKGADGKNYVSLKASTLPPEELVVAPELQPAPTNDFAPNRND